MKKKQITKVYWEVDGSIGDAIQTFLDNNLDYKLVNYRICFFNEILGVYALVLYELREELVLWKIK